MHRWRGFPDRASWRGSEIPCAILGQLPSATLEGAENLTPLIFHRPEVSHQAHLPAQEALPPARPRVPPAHGFAGWPAGHPEPAPQGPSAADAGVARVAAGS